MPVLRAPQVTSRVCGSCGPFHQLASCLAIERATGTEVPESARLVRELLCWLWLAHSHLLRFTYQVLPDLALPMSDAAVRNVTGIYKVEQEIVRRLTGVQSVFHQAVSAVAGMPVHPSLVVPGGVSSVPGADAVESVAEGLSAIEDDLRETLRLVEMLMKRGSRMMYTGNPLTGHYVAMTSEGHCDLTGDTIVAAHFDGGGRVSFTTDEFEAVLREEPVGWSYIVPVFAGDLGDVLTGPLARANVGFGPDTPWASEEAEACRSEWETLDREFLTYMWMMLEVIWAWEKACKLVTEIEPGSTPAVSPPRIAPSSGAAVVGGPSGLLVHSIEIDEDGRAVDYRIVSPLQLNYGLMNRHLEDVAVKVVQGAKISESVSQRLQLAVRAFNPCVPCGTH